MSMPPRGGFEVRGLREVVRDLKAIGVAVDDLKAAFAKIATEGARRAAAHAPKKSGRLAGDVRGNRAQSKANISAGRAAIPYAGPINYGWPARGIPANPFMQKADEEMRPRAITLLEQEINETIKKRGL